MENHLKTLTMITRRQYHRLVQVAGVVVVLALAGGPAIAQQAAAQPAAAPSANALPSWIKTCDIEKTTKKEICIVTQEIRADSGTFIASATLRRVSGDKKYSLLA